MPPNPYTVWVLIRDLDRGTFSRSPGFTIAAELGGLLIEHIYVPGLLLGFENARNAARAALRIHPELVRTSPDGIVPPIAIDAAGDAKRITAVAYGLPANTVLVTDAIGRHLAAEALEMLAGPRIEMDNGPTVLTHLLSLSSHNMGWALPVLTTAPRSASYVRRTEPAVVNITMTPPRSFFRLPWKMVMILTFLFLGFWFALAVTRNMARSRRAQVVAVPTVIEEEPINVLDEIGINPTATPLPAGFATVVIQAVPPDSKIYLNDELVGQKSPVVVPNKSNQHTYKLMVKKKGYETYTGLFNVEAEERKVIDIRLAKAIPKTW